MANTADACYHCDQVFERQTILTTWGGPVKLGLCRCDYLHCKSCSAVIPPRASTCARCGTPLPPWPGRRG